MGSYVTFLFQKQTELQQLFSARYFGWSLISQTNDFIAAKIYLDPKTKYKKLLKDFWRNASIEYIVFPPKSIPQDFLLGMRQDSLCVDFSWQIFEDL